MRPKRFAVATAVALLLMTAGPAMAETDIVLDNETSNTNVETGDSSFTNNESTSVGSGVSAGEPARQQSSTPGIASQGLSATLPLSTVVDTPSGSTPTLERVGADQTSQKDTTEEVLFVGFPISTSIAP